MNETEAFRYRIINKEVFLYDVVNASPTINRPDGTFGFAYMPYQPTFEKFVETANVEMDRVRNSKGLEPALSGENAYVGIQPPGT